MRTVMLALLVAVGSLSLGASVAPPPEDLVSLIQTRNLEVKKAEIDVNDIEKMLPEASLNLDDEHTVDNLIKTTQRLVKDIRISLDMNGPRVRSKVTENDLRKTRELHTNLEAQLREIKLAKMPVMPLHQKPKQLKPKMVLATVNSLKTRLYSPYNGTAYLISGNRAFCVQGPTHYMKNVLRRLRDSPLKYGWPKETTWLEYGVCADRGYAVSAPDTTCFKQTTVWLDGTARHKKLYEVFNDQMVRKWVTLERSNYEIARKENRHLCMPN